MASLYVRYQDSMRDMNAQKRVLFRLSDAGACRVYLAGSFNAWDPTAHPLKKDKRGLWKTSIILDPGIYQYRFVVDGEWKADPYPSGRRMDGSITYHSVLVV